MGKRKVRGQPALDALEALVAKWRAQADVAESGNEKLRRCANELEAALAHDESGGE